MSEKILIDNQTYRLSDIKTFDNPIDQAYWKFCTGEMKELPEGAKRGYKVGYSVAWQKEFYHVADLIYEAIINEEDRQKLVDYVKQVQNMSSAKGEFLTLDIERSINHPEEEPSYGNWRYALYYTQLCTVYRREALTLIETYESSVSSLYEYLPVEFSEEEGFQLETIPIYFR
jgi:hypothetical protein